MYGISKRSFSLRHIYSKHRRLQILGKNEQPALVNTPVLQDPNQVHLLWRTEVTPVAYKREHCQLHFVAIETVFFFNHLDKSDTTALILKILATISSVLQYYSTIQNCYPSLSCLGPILSHHQITCNKTTWTNFFTSQMTCLHHSH